jgi:hypothetical protein
LKREKRSKREEEACARERERERERERRRSQEGKDDNSQLFSFSSKTIYHSKILCLNRLEI